MTTRRPSPTPHRRLPVVLPPPRKIPPARHWNEVLEKYDEGPPSEEERIQHSIDHGALPAEAWREAWRSLHESAGVMRIALKVARDHLRKLGDTGLADEITIVLEESL